MGKAPCLFILYSLIYTLFLPFFIIPFLRQDRHKKYLEPQISIGFYVGLKMLNNALFDLFRE